MGTDSGDGEGSADGEYRDDLNEDGILDCTDAVLGIGSAADQRADRTLRGFELPNIKLPSSSSSEVAEKANGDG
jgi:hypothetical protein